MGRIQLTKLWALFKEHRNQKLLKCSGQFYCTNHRTEEPSGLTGCASAMDLSNVLKRLHKFASPTLAGDWDNVGLLVEPSPPHVVNTIFLTNDLTPPVLQEAIDKKSDLILAYHPPIFASLKRLTQKKWKEEIIVKCIENRIAVFSPHTSYDCVQDGVNDWLISCFNCSEVKPVEAHYEYPSIYTKRLEFDLAADKCSDIVTQLKSLPEMKLTQATGNPDNTSTPATVHIHVQCTDISLAAAMKVVAPQMSAISNLQTQDLIKIPKPGYGMGRKGKLSQSISLDEAVHTVKAHLGLGHVRLATAPGAPMISSVAVCAGSGSSVLRNVTASLYVTGEMSHHDVLHAVYNGSSVILCEHSNTERGYLYQLQKKLSSLLESGVNVVVSQTDADPLVIV